MTHEHAEGGGGRSDRPSPVSPLPQPASGVRRAYVTPFFRRLDVSDDTAGKPIPETAEPTPSYRPS